MIRKLKCYCVVNIKSEDLTLALGGGQYTFEEFEGIVASVQLTTQAHLIKAKEWFNKHTDEMCVIVVLHENGMSEYLVQLFDESQTPFVVEELLKRSGVTINHVTSVQQLANSLENKLS